MISNTFPATLRRVLPAAAGIGVLVAVAGKLGAGAFLAGLQAIDLDAVLAALVIGAVTTVAGAGRWVLVARGLGVLLPLRAAVGDCYQALFLNSVLPAGVLGDVHRAVDHGRRSGDVGRGVRAVVLERLAGQVVLVLLAVGLVLAQPQLVPVLAVAVLPSGWGTALVVAGLGVLVAVGAVVFGERLQMAGRRLAADLRAVCTAKVWPGVAALSTLALAGYVAMFVVAARVAGSAAPVATLLPVLVLALLVMGLPLNAGGFGPREAVTAVAFGALGMGASIGLTASVVYGVLSLVACLPGGAVLLTRRLNTLRGSRGMRAPRELQHGHHDATFLRDGGHAANPSAPDRAALPVAEHAPARRREVGARRLAVVPAGDDRVEHLAAAVSQQRRAGCIELPVAPPHQHQQHVA